MAVYECTKELSRQLVNFMGMPFNKRLALGLVRTPLTLGGDID